MCLPSETRPVFVMGTGDAPTGQVENHAARPGGAKLNILQVYHREAFLPLRVALDQTSQSGVNPGALHI